MAQVYYSQLPQVTQGIHAHKLVKRQIDLLQILSFGQSGWQFVNIIVRIRNAYDFLGLTQNWQLFEPAQLGRFTKILNHYYSQICIKLNPQTNTSGDNFRIVQVSLKQLVRLSSKKLKCVVFRNLLKIRSTISYIYIFIVMLPKLQQSSLAQSLRKDNPATLIQTEDQLKNIVGRANNQSYKPWKNQYAPKNPHSPFGDFPSDYLPKKKLQQKKHEPNQELSMSGSLQKHAKLSGTGGRTSSTLEKKEKHQPPPPKSGAFEKRDVPASEFRRYYDRGDLPIRVDHQSSLPKLVWKVSAESLDYHHYLPIFFDGCRQKIDPYRSFAIMGTYDLLDKGGSKILPVIPQLIIPIKTALNTRDADIIAVMLKVIQKLVLSGDMIGEALVPYYRQILPIFNIFRNSNKNCGDKIEYDQRKRLNIGDLISETLELLEQTGGQDAFINIKYMIPTYESCVLN